MRVRDLRAVLEDLGRIFGASGARKQHVAITQVAEALPAAKGSDQDIGLYLTTLEEELADDFAPASVKYLRKLKEAGLVEQAFLATLNLIETDRQIKKVDLLAIAEGYTGSSDRKASAKKLLSHIKGHFYKRLYERDANELAKRATPV